MAIIVKYKSNRYSKSSQFRCNRRIIQEYGLQEAKRIGALDRVEEEKKKKKQLKKQRKQNKQKQMKTGVYIGVFYEIKYNEFIESGGDPNSCPFD